MSSYKQLQRAFTLIEMLIAMALTLILVYAVAEFYAYVGTSVRDGRALIEMGSQLRSAAQQLHDDLNSLTLRPEPWIDPVASPGYFTVYEGIGYDADPDANTIANNSLMADSNNDQVPDIIVTTNSTTLFGDADDVIAGTIRAGSIPFQGRFNNGTEYSQHAEVIWFTCFNDVDGNSTWNLGETRFLCRRQLLVRPNVIVQGVGVPGRLTNFMTQAQAVTNLKQIQQSNDISASIAQDPATSQYYVRANSLADLSLRQNRFGCALSGNGSGTSSYPFALDLDPNRCAVNAGTLSVYLQQGASLGEDRVLFNVLAFDVRVFDPGAPIYRDTNSLAALVPGDPGYSAAAGQAANFQGFGAWVDLYYNLGINREGGTPVPNNNNPPAYFAAAPLNFTGYGIWDTWPTAYQKPPYTNGQAFDGQDNDGNYGVDDPGERNGNYLAPYAAPLRGVQVRIRIYEPQTRQARQVTVGADFVAE